MECKSVFFSILSPLLVSLAQINQFTIFDKLLNNLINKFIRIPLGSRDRNRVVLHREKGTLICATNNPF